MSLPNRYIRACTEQVHRRYNEYYTTTAVQLGTHDTVTYLDTTLGAAVVTLPPVAEVAGIRYLVKHWLGAPTVTFQNYRGDSPALPAITALPLNGSVLLESDGEKWHVIP